jgi:hypothetical protein
MERGGGEIIGNIFIVPIHLSVTHREPPFWAASRERQDRKIHCNNANCAPFVDKFVSIFYRLLHGDAGIAEPHARKRLAEGGLCIPDVRTPAVPSRNDARGTYARYQPGLIAEVPGTAEMV